MPAWLAPAAISAGTSLLGGLFGGRKQRRGLSPEARGLYGQLTGEYGKTPSYVTSPIEARWGARKQGIREGMGEALGPGSGLETAQLMRATTAEGREMGEATERHRRGLLSALVGLLGGTGTTEEPTDWGGVLGGIGGDVGFLWGLEKFLGGGQGAGGDGGGTSGGGLKYKRGFLGGGGLR